MTLREKLIAAGIIIPAKVREQLELAQAPKPRITSTEAELTARELLIQKHRSPEAMPTPPVPKQITKAMEKAQTNKVASKPTKKVKNKPAKTSARLVKVENGGEVPIFLKTTSGHQMSPVTVTPRVTPSTGIQSDGPLSRAGKSRVERAVSGKPGQWNPRAAGLEGQAGSDPERGCILQRMSYIGCPPISLCRQ